MARVYTNRQVRFSAALALCKMSKKQWAAAQKPPIHRVHLNAVLRDERESPRLIALVDQFTADVEQRFRAKVQAA